MRLRERPNDISCFEDATNNLVVWKMDSSLEGLKCVNYECRMVVLVSLLPRLVAVLKDANTEVFQEDFGKRPFLHVLALMSSLTYFFQTSS